MQHALCPTMQLLFLLLLFLSIDDRLQIDYRSHLIFQKNHHQHQQQHKHHLQPPTSPLCLMDVNEASSLVFHSHSLVGHLISNKIGSDTGCVLCLYKKVLILVLVVVLVLVLVLVFGFFGFAAKKQVCDQRRKPARSEAIFRAN